MIHADIGPADYQGACEGVRTLCTTIGSLSDRPPFPSIVQFDLPAHDEPLKMERLVTVLAAEYNRHHAADPVREVDLMMMAVKLHLPPGQLRSQPSCELLQRFDLSPAPSS